MFGKVTSPWWDEKPVFIIGGGPSLAGINLSKLKSHGWVLGINKAAEIVPCDAFFTQDYKYIDNSVYNLLKKGSKDMEFFLSVAIDYDFLARGFDDSRITYLERVRGTGLSFNPCSVTNGLHSGFGALNLAILKHAKLIYLLGYDLNPVNPKSNNRWHNGYEWDNRRSIVYYQRWADIFQEVAESLPAGVEVINANPKSAVRAFPFTTYKEIGL